VEVLLGMVAVVAKLRRVTKPDGEVVIHGFVVEEVLFDRRTFVTQAEDKITIAVMGVGFHDVP